MFMARIPVLPGAQRPPEAGTETVLVAKGRAGDNAEPVSVSELSGALKRSIEDRFGFVRVRGELSGVKRAASGHLYCCLKDERAVLDGVMWRTAVAGLAFQPEDGLEVIASGKLTTYAGRSKYQIVMDRIELAGEGALLALLERLRARLEDEGLFAESRKQALPFLPRVIGVVTSPTGSVIRDILHRLADRFPSHVVVWPVQVQGNDAARQVAAALRGFGELQKDGPVPRPDLVIVARGGGSIEDLWAFNEEETVRAIAASPIPVICAVGHETDTTLSDFAADRRAPTPTAAAEMAVPVLNDLAADLLDRAGRLRRAAGQPVRLGRERLAARAQRLPAPDRVLEQRAQTLDERAERLRRGLKDRAGVARQLLTAAAGRLSPAGLRELLGRQRLWLEQLGFRPALVARPVERGAERLSAIRFDAQLVRRVYRERSRSLSGVRLDPRHLNARLRMSALALDTARRMLAALDPKAALARGFVLVRDAAGQLVTRAENAGKADRLTLEFADGSVAARPLPRSSSQGTSAPALKHEASTGPSKGKTPTPAKTAHRNEKRQGDLFG
jgi:exodeoxyribonuclease VII large subunit